MTTVTADFDLDSWDEETFDDAAGARLFKIVVTKTYRGDITGTSVTTLLSATSDTDDGSAAYGGLERMHVSVQGKEGTFVLRHAAVMSPDGGPRMEVLVVPNTGTGELAGISGTAQIDIGPGGEHSLTLQLD